MCVKQQEATVCSETTMAATDVVSVDDVVPSVLSEPGSFSSLKEEQRATLKAFLDGKDVFAQV